MNKIKEPDHFKGLPMKVIVDVVTEILIHEFGWTYLSDMQVLELRAKIDRIMWKSKDYAKEIYAVLEK
jgi:hypothetical protein